MLVRFWKYEGNDDNAVRFQTEVTRSGTFTVDVEFTPAQRGLYWIEVFLFWPESGGQTPRSVLTPILVE